MGLEDHWGFKRSFSAVPAPGGVPCADCQSLVYSCIEAEQIFKEFQNNHLLVENEGKSANLNKEMKDKTAIVIILFII